MEILKRVLSVALVYVGGAALAAAFVAVNAPDPWPFSTKVDAWREVSAGPFYLFPDWPPHELVSQVSAIALLASPCSLAYAVRPSRLSFAATCACVTLWYMAGCLTFIMVTWGA